MHKKILDYYLGFSVFTNPGCYKKYLQDLPDDVGDLGDLLSHQIIHRVTLKDGNTNANDDKRYGDMDTYPWHKLRCDDDIVPTAIAMIAELFRMDERGVIKDRAVENKLVVTCRYAAILLAAVLKSKGIPCRVRSGFAPYFFETSGDHWINQYWAVKQNRWITVDADGFFKDVVKFDQYNMPEEEFDWAAKVWLGLRRKELIPEKFEFAGGENGLKAAIRAIIHDFHCLMNNEILYMQQPVYISNKFDKLTEADFQEIDELAQLMINPDENFNNLEKIWNTKKKFRTLNSPLIGDEDHNTK